MDEDKEVTDTNVGNIEKDIEKCKELIKDKHKEWIGLTNQKAIENVLEAYEKLKVLEDDIQDKRIAYIDTPEFKDAFVPKQKIKDKIYEIKVDKDSKYYDMFFVGRDIENTINILEELLKDK